MRVHVHVHVHVTPERSKAATDTSVVLRSGALFSLSGKINLSFTLQTFAHRKKRKNSHILASAALALSLNNHLSALALAPDVLTNTPRLLAAAGHRYRF